VLTIDPKLYPPIDQALGVVASSKQRGRARQFTAFLLGAEGRAKLLRGGYLVP